MDEKKLKSLLDKVDGIATNHVKNTLDLDGIPIKKDTNIESKNNPSTVIINEYQSRNEEERNHRKIILYFTIIILTIQNIFLMWIIGYFIYISFGFNINEINFSALQEIVGLTKVFITGLIVEFIGIIVIITKEIFKNHHDIDYLN